MADKPRRPAPGDADREAERLRAENERLAPAVRVRLFESFAERFQQVWDTVRLVVTAR